MCTASSHISCVLRCSDIVNIQLVMFFMSFELRPGLNFMDRKNFFVSCHQIQKKPMFMPIIFLFLAFHLLAYTNPNILMDAKQ